MKKLVTAFTLMLAFSISANAQTKKQAVLTSSEKGKNETVELTKYLNLNETQKTNISSILEQKHQTLEIKDLSDERKQALSHAVDAQIRASLNAEQAEKFQKNTDLHERITH